MTNTAAAPLLRSPTNPDGYLLKDLLLQIGEEIAEENLRLRFDSSPESQAVLALRRLAQRKISHAADVMRQVHALQALDDDEPALVIDHPAMRQLHERPAQYRSDL